MVADMIFGSAAHDYTSSSSTTSTPLPNAFLVRQEINDIRAGLQLATAMRAVNQAIGRCIRHKDDYATIFLCDTRYNNHHNQNNPRSTAAGQYLPMWMEPAKIMCPQPEALATTILPNVRNFFKEKQEQQ